MRFTLPLAALLLAATPALAQTPLTGTAPPTTSAPPLAGTAARPGIPAATAPSTTPPATASLPSTSLPSTSLPSTPAHPSTAAHRSRRTQAERFEAANTTHDGKLTLDQARAGHMNAVVRDFADIDKDHKGFVTETEIRDHRRAVRAAHKAAAANHS